MHTVGETLLLPQPKIIINIYMMLLPTGNMIGCKLRKRELGDGGKAG